MNVDLQTLKNKGHNFALGFSALGVVFGDIGTSPLYTMQACFSGALSPTPEHVLGVVSLILWALVIVVSIKYALVVMSISNRGEGGIMSLTALAGTAAKQAGKNTTLIAFFGIAGVSLFFGDSLITPAISVLSAVEGLSVIAPHFGVMVVPISIVILITLFFFQRHGTHNVGSYFAPVMILWFLVIGFLGLQEITRAPEILNAANPKYALALLFEHGFFSFVVLSFIILSFTGAEALYADMGHFGPFPIRCAWFFLVFPALILNYAGQGALLLKTPEAASNPFYMLVPEHFLLAMILLSSMATVIASQAVISGTFSIVQQLIHLGLLPRMAVQHTSSSQYGQIYIPQVNWIICVGVLLLVAIFRTSGALSGAYGFSVMGTMFATTLLIFSVMHYSWGWKSIKAAAALLPFFVVDLSFFGASFTKISEGGWVPLGLGVIAAIIFFSWHRGRAVVLAHHHKRSHKLETFAEEIKYQAILRVPGTAIYLANLRATTPAIMLNNIRHNKVLHKRVIVLNIQSESEPRVPEGYRLSSQKLPNGFWQATLHYGFMERPNVLEDLQKHMVLDDPLNNEEVSYFVGRNVFVESETPMRPAWSKKLFLWLSNHSMDNFEYLRIPSEKVVEIGIQVAV